MEKLLDVEKFFKYHEELCYVCGNINPKTTISAGVVLCEDCLSDAFENFPKAEIPPLFQNLAYIILDGSKIWDYRMLDWLTDKIGQYFSGYDEFSQEDFLAFIKQIKEAQNET
jgi:hypothetical protein